MSQVREKCCRTIEIAGLLRRVSWRATCRSHLACELARLCSSLPVGCRRRQLTTRVKNERLRNCAIAAPSGCPLIHWCQQETSPFGNGRVFRLHGPGQKFQREDTARLSDVAKNEP